MNKKTLSILVSLIVISLFSWWFFHRSPSLSSDEEGDFETQETGTGHPSKSGNTSMGSPESQSSESAPFQSFDPAIPPAYAKFFLRRSLKDKAEAMLKVFPPTETGKSLSLIATLLPYGTMESDRPAVAALARQLGVLKTHPEEAFKDLQQGVQNLPSNYFRERQFLVQFAPRLNVSQEAKVQFLSSEINRPASLGTNGVPDVSFFNGAVALDTLIDTVHDPKIIEPILTQALAAQTTDQARLILLSRYERLDAEGAQRLRNQYVH